ncbi:MAG: septum formation initiator family protein [Acidobacteria bacterium]|nr:septum formation initiator family protein [Acidobacteriota bacterium]
MTFQIRRCLQRQGSTVRVPGEPVFGWLAWKRRLATGAVILLALWIGYVAIWGADGVLAYNRKRGDYRALQKRIEELRQENERLVRDNRALRTNPAAIEREAREQLHYTRPGEVVLIQPEAQPQTQPASATAQNTR